MSTVEEVGWASEASMPSIMVDRGYNRVGQTCAAIGSARQKPQGTTAVDGEVATAICGGRCEVPQL